MENGAGISSQVAMFDYLQLLTTQLRNQDPLDPVDQQGMVNDLTQFSQLEGIEQLNDSFSNMLKMQELTHGASLVGREVTFQNTGTGEIKTGLVDEVFASSNGTSVLVDGQSVSLENVLSVRNSSGAATV